jgi:adenylosuccinate lyase
MEMILTPLTAISPVDGRYRRTTERLGEHFSEGALIKYRIMVEVEYFLALCELPLPQLAAFDFKTAPRLREIYTYFSIEDARRVKEIEKETNHDVKAVEYFLKEKFDELGLKPFKEFIHFGLTSQDITNTAVPYSLKKAWLEEVKPVLLDLMTRLTEKSMTWKNVPMLARTHGQPASPTNAGKEIYVFVERLNRQLKLLDAIPFSAKFGGATGNFNANAVAYPDIDWFAFADRLLSDQFGLTRSPNTTQIEHYDNLAAFCNGLQRINTILIDMARDIWAYISLDYFKQQLKEGEIGSSTMPHKVNPIDFENAEGNLGIANAILSHLSAKLPISRLQRDLSDSTVIRNVGVPLAHMLISLKSLLRGLSKLLINQEAIQKDLHDNWAVVAEAIQTILRREGYPEPYEALKALTRTNETIGRKAIADFIAGLNVTEEVKAELIKITPENYIGILEY